MTRDRLTAKREGRVPSSVAGLVCSVAFAVRRADDIERFVGWPALEDSWRQQAEALRKVLNAVGGEGGPR